jgi:hypothetical protein
LRAVERCGRRSHWRGRAALRAAVTEMGFRVIWDMHTWLQCSIWVVRGNDVSRQDRGPDDLGQQRVAWAVC